MEEKKNVLDNLEEYLLVFLIGVITLLTLVSFVVQFFNKDAVAGINQLSFIAYTWLVFLGVAVAVKHNSHMRIDILYNAYPKPVQRILGIVIEILMGIFCVALAVLSIMALVNVVKSGEMNAVIAVPMSVLYLAPAVGFLLAVFRYIQRLVTRKSEGVEKK